MVSRSPTRIFLLNDRKPTSDPVLRCLPRVTGLDYGEQQVGRGVELRMYTNSVRAYLRMRGKRGQFATTFRRVIGTVHAR